MTRFELNKLVNVIGGLSVWSLNDKDNLHDINEQDVDTNYEIHKGNGYGYDLDLLITLTSFDS